MHDAAVIGVTLRGQEELGELPRAYVVVDDGTTSCNKMGCDTTVTEQELKDFLGARLSKYKALTGGVRFVDALPRGASGKILRGVLRGWVRSELEHEV